MGSLVELKEPEWVAYIIRRAKKGIATIGYPLFVDYVVLFSVDRNDCS